jgi:hypothetical protein
MIAGLLFFVASKVRRGPTKEFLDVLRTDRHFNRREDLSRGPALEKRIRHFECFNIVRIIGHRKKTGKGDSEITDNLTAHCAKLRPPRRNICEAIVPSRIDNISAQLASKHKPQDICESLGFARPPSARRFVPRDQCVKFAEKAKVQPDGLDVSGTNVSLKGKLPKPFGGRGLFSQLFGKPLLCKAAAPEERIGCYVVARLVIKGLRRDLTASMTGSEICDKLEEKKLIQFKPPDDANATDTLSQFKKAEDGKADEKKTNDKTADEKTTGQKTNDSKATDDKKADDKTADDKKANEKKSDAKGESGTTPDAKK